jgi:hypothetical protein
MHARHYLNRPENTLHAQTATPWMSTFVHSTRHGSNPALPKPPTGCNPSQLHLSLEPTETSVPYRIPKRENRDVTDRRVYLDNIDTMASKAVGYFRGLCSRTRGFRQYARPCMDPSWWLVRACGAREVKIA